MLTLSGAIQGFRPYLQRMGFSAEIQYRYGTFVARNIPWQVFRLLPCSQYRPHEPPGALVGVGARTAARYRSIWQKFHAHPQIAGAAFLTMGAWLDSFVPHYAGNRAAPRLAAGTALGRLVRAYAEQLPAGVLDRRIGKSLLQWSAGLPRTSRVALRSYFRYLQQEGVGGHSAPGWRAGALP